MNMYVYVRVTKWMELGIISRCGGHPVTNWRIGLRRLLWKVTAVIVEPEKTYIRVRIRKIDSTSILGLVFGILTSLLVFVDLTQFVPQNASVASLQSYNALCQ